MKGQTLGAAIKLAIFTVVTIVATTVLAFTIGNSTGGTTRAYRAAFTDATDLNPGDDVRIDGVRVGTVKFVKALDGRDAAQCGAQTTLTACAEVTFDVDDSVAPMLQSTTLSINYLNLVGQRYIAIHDTAGSGQAQARDQVIPVSRTAPALDLTALFNGFRPLFQALSPQDVNSFSLEVVKTLQGEGGTVEDLVAQSASLTNTLADRDAVIGQVIDNLESVLGTVEQRNSGLSQLISQLQRLVTGLADNRQTIAASLQNIDDLSANSALLLQQIRPYLPSDLSSLSKVANTLATTNNCSDQFDSDGHSDISKYPLFAPNCSNGPNTLEEYLQRAPTKITQIIRTATYGQFFNFYLCDLEYTSALSSSSGTKSSVAGLSLTNLPPCKAANR